MWISLEILNLNNSLFENMDLDFIRDLGHSNISINLRIWNDNLNPVIWNEMHVSKHPLTRLVQYICVHCFTATIRYGTVYCLLIRKKKLTRTGTINELFSVYSLAVFTYVYYVQLLSFLATKIWKLHNLTIMIWITGTPIWHIWHEVFWQ